MQALFTTIMPQAGWQVERDFSMIFTNMTPCAKKAASARPWVSWPAAHSKIKYKTKP
jgi:hypothetical protein